MASGELLKGFGGLAMLHERADHSFERIWHFGGEDSGEDLTAYRLVFSEAAADEDVIGFETFAAEFGSCAEAADVAHVMLGAGMGAAGDVDINRLVEIETL